jgi:hypothetical protein
MNNHIIENLNYFNDSRTQGPAESNPTVIIYGEDGEETEVALPTSWQVCPVCNGEGKHVNPSIDCGGIPSERFHDDPEFAESYFSGAYDVPCNHCSGRSTVLGVDFGALSPEMENAYNAECEAEAENRAEQRAEMLAGC